MTNATKNDFARKKRNLDISAGFIYGKIPPQAKDLEEAILGAILLDKSAFDTVLEIIKAESFYVEAHQLIFKAMMNLTAKSQPLDSLTVTEELKLNENLERIGGTYYLTKLTNSVVSSANLPFHCRIIQERFIKRELIRIGSELISASYEDATEVRDLLDEHEKQFTSITSSTGDRFIQLDSALVTAFKKVMLLKQQDKHITGVPSGFTRIDNITHGWQNQDLVILAARPAVGKTAFALNIARNAAINEINKVPVGLFSLEMSTGQLVNRMMSSESNVWLDRIINGKIDDIGMNQLFIRGVRPLSQAPIYIDDTPALTIFELRAKARRMKRKFNVGLIIIDYLQLMSGDSNDSKNREREIAQISRGLKGLAKELNIPIIALSQLSREPDKRKGDARTPQLSDLRESGAIEQDADLVMFMYRPEYYDTKVDELGESTQGLTIISISKHRNGALANGNEAIKLKANLSIQKFTEWDDIYDSQATKAYVSIGSKMSNETEWQPIEIDKKDENMPF